VGRESAEFIFGKALGLWVEGLAGYVMDTGVGDLQWLAVAVGTKAVQTTPGDKAWARMRCFILNENPSHLY
jgi:hypothetical protein